MKTSTLHKVCFSIDGKPAIIRGLETYKACGIACNIIVVGALAVQVMDTVSQEFENVIFAYQPRQLGTAHAARQGAKVLAALDEKAEVLIVAGDRIVDAQVLEQLVDLFYGQNCDLAFLTLPRRRFKRLGRVLLYPDGSVLGNVELADIWQRQIYSRIRAAAEAGIKLARADIAELIREKFDEAKAATAFGDLWQALFVENRTPTAEEILGMVREDLTRFEFFDQQGKKLSVSPDEVEQATQYNTSVYLVKAEALQYAFTRLNRDNAQKEEYLSDMITILAQARERTANRFRVRALSVQDEQAVMAFNDPAELLEIETYLQSKRRSGFALEQPEGAWFRKVSHWLDSFLNLADRKTRNASQSFMELRAELETLYGKEEAFLDERIQAYIRLLHHAAAVLGSDARICLVRSPGRVNMMGRHVDHQGGICNLMTIGYETLLAASPRKDDRVCLHNLDPDHFPNREFSIGELVAELPWDDWLSLVNSDKVAALALSAGGDWAQYAKAVAVRLQKKFASQKLHGLDLIVSGDIPVAAGLSSSSALVVATAEAVVALNRLNTFPSQFVDLCGEGEWFVGTRGGSADHAAIKYGQKGKVVRVSFFDFAVEDTVSFPTGFSLLVCDSGLKAQKTTNAMNQFNHRVACYRAGTLLIKRLFPQYAPLVRHLRDVNTRTLGVPLAWIYKLLLRLPEEVNREELRELLAGSEVGALFQTHSPPADGLYPIRGVVLYGLAECERSHRFAKALRNQSMEKVGRMMNASHNGDRVVRYAADGSQELYRAPTGNSYLMGLIDDLESGEPERVVAAQLQWQPGSYRCSLPEIDLMVDVALRVEGVVGAQLAGAGLGGCMMVLVHSEAVRNLREAMDENYYRPFGKPTSVLGCTPINGSSVLMSG